MIPQRFVENFRISILIDYVINSTDTKMSFTHGATGIHQPVQGADTHHSIVQMLLLY